MLSARSFSSAWNCGAMLSCKMRRLVAVQIWPVVQKHPNYIHTASCSAQVVCMHLVSLQYSGICEVLRAYHGCQARPALAGHFCISRSPISAWRRQGLRGFFLTLQADQCTALGCERHDEAVEIRAEARPKLFCDLS